MVKDYGNLTTRDISGVTTSDLLTHSQWSHVED